MDYSKIDKKLLKIKLEDDNTSYGGTSFMGETLEDFLNDFEDLDIEINNLDELNELLKECGIKPIKPLKEMFSKLLTKEEKLLNNKGLLSEDAYSHYRQVAEKYFNNNLDNLQRELIKEGLVENRDIERTSVIFPKKEYLDKVLDVINNTTKSKYFNEFGIVETFTTEFANGNFINIDIICGEDNVFIEATLYNENGKTLDNTLINNLYDTIQLRDKDNKVYTTHIENRLKEDLEEDKESGYIVSITRPEFYEIENLTPALTYTIINNVRKKYAYLDEPYLKDNDEEISFKVEDIDKAQEIAKQFNQESFFDIFNDTLVDNKYFNNNVKVDYSVFMPKEFLDNE